MGWKICLLPVLVLVAAIALALYYVVAIYNRFVRQRKEVERAWANIDVLLKQRHDELPNLVAICRGYMTHERETLTAVAALRSSFSQAASQPEKASANTKTLEGLKSLFALVENYPDLKANEHFLKLQKRLSEIEDMIADRRELYNSSIAIYNTHIEQFPDSIIANFFRFKTGDFLTFEAEIHIVPTVGFDDNDDANAHEVALKRPHILRWLETHKSLLSSFDINQDNQIDLDELSWAYNTVLKYREMSKNNDSRWYAFIGGQVSAIMTWAALQETLKGDVSAFVCPEGAELWLPLEIITI